MEPIQVLMYLRNNLLIYINVDLVTKTLRTKSVLIWLDHPRILPSKKEIFVDRLGGNQVHESALVTINSLNKSIIQYICIPFAFLQWDCSYIGTRLYRDP